MPDYTPKHTNHQPFGRTASAAITGGTPVAISGSGTVGPAAANSLAVVGIAGHDAAAGQRVTVHPLPGAIHRLAAAVAISAGSPVKANGSGQIAAHVSGTDAAERQIGVADTAATATGDIVEVTGR